MNLPSMSIYLLISCVTMLPFLVDHVDSVFLTLVGTDAGQNHHVQERALNTRDSNLNNSNRINRTDSHPEHCRQNALTDEFGMITQLILAVLAFSSLILKRLREPKEERRSWRIWFYDTSKQALGAGVIHVANVFLSAELANGDPCLWYIVNFLLDSTFGLLFIYISVKISQCIVKLCNCKTLYFGEYGNPPMCEAWVGQCGLFVLIVVVEKVVITFFACLNVWSEIARTLLSPIHNPKVEVVIVMLLVPFILNAVMFWVIDNFLMRKRKKVKDNPGNGKVQARYFKLKSSTKDGGRGPESEVLLSQDEENGETVILTSRGSNENCVGRSVTIL